MKVLAIVKKELQTYFFSPVAYIIFAAFSLVIGFLFWLILMSTHLASMKETLFNCAFVLLLASPVLTMRLISEEKRSNTMELLLTSPISAAEIIIGKFLACFFVYLLLMGVTLQYALILSSYCPTLDWGPITSGYIGLILLGASFISFGLFASTVTENQMIAAMISFGGLLTFWLIGWSKHALENTMGEFFSKLSLLERYWEFPNGMVDSGNIIFFVTFSLIWLFLATRVLESDRWR